MTIGERIKKVRRSVDLTQQKFADRLGIKQNTVATYEMNRTNPSDSAIKSICREFNVSETWLKTGEGEPFNPTPKTHIDELVRQYGLDDVDREIIMEFIKLKPEEKKIVKDYIQRVAQHMKEMPTQEPLTPEQEIDQKVELYRQHLVLEQEQASQALSAKESDVG